MKKLLLLALCLVLALALCACASGGREVIAWDSLALGGLLPEPEYLAGHLYADSEDYLSVSLARTDADAFRAYARACEDKGFTVEKQKTDWDFRAFNAEGYELTIWHSDREMDVTLRAPLELHALVWPDTALGRMLPVPESTVGQVSYETEEYLELYVGDTDPAAYSAYVTACIDAGFDIDYSRGDDYFYGDSAAGYDLSVSYEGFRRMRIHLSKQYE